MHDVFLAVVKALVKQLLSGCITEEEFKTNLAVLAVSEFKEEI